MYFLLEVCQNPTVLRVLYFMQLFLDIIFIILPIGLIIALMVDFSKVVISGKEEVQLKSTKLVVNRILYAVIVFAIPWFIDFFMGTLESLKIGVNNNYVTCLNNVTAIKTGKQSFEYYDNLLEAEEKKQQLELELARSNSSNNKINKSNNATNGNSGNNSSKNGIDNSGINLASGTTYQESALAMVNLARGEMGHVGGEKYGAGSLPWCAYFVKWLINKTTIQNVGTVSSVITKEGPIGGCRGNCAGDMVQNFSSHKNLSFYSSQHYGGNYTPKAGDIIIFWYKNKNGRYWNKTVSDAADANHIGIVESYSNGKVKTIEGNCGNKVQSFSYNLSDDSILGYGSWYGNTK
ncbi:MAG: CHAP domain-containing protein [Bacilli bacterium]